MWQPKPAHVYADVGRGSPRIGAERESVKRGQRPIACWEIELSLVQMREIPLGLNGTVSSVGMPQD